MGELMKNSRLSIDTQTLLLRFFLRGTSAGDVARMTDIWKPTVIRFFERSRCKLIANQNFLGKVLASMAMVNQDSARFLMQQCLSVEPGQLFDCVYHCSTNTPPAGIRKRLKSMPSKDEAHNFAENVVRLRSGCGYCPMKLFAYKPCDLPEVALLIPSKFKSIMAQVLEKSDKTYFNDPIRMWVGALFYLGGIRRIKAENLSLFLLSGILGPVIRSRDLRFPNHLRIPYAIEVPEILSRREFEADYHIENDVEMIILNTALEILKNDPL
jgi:hypothetical protein